MLVPRRADWYKNDDRISSQSDVRNRKDTSIMNYCERFIIEIIALTQIVIFITILYGIINGLQLKPQLQR